MARRPIFKGARGAYVATQRIQIVGDTFIEPGELIPEGIRAVSIKRWFNLGMIGPVGDPWTAHLLGRRERKLLADKEAKRLHPGGEADLERIAKAKAGKAPKAAYQPGQPIGGAGGVPPAKAAKSGHKGAKAAPPPPTATATFGTPPAAPPPPAPPAPPAPAPDPAPGAVSDADPEQQPAG